MLPGSMRKRAVVEGEADYEWDLPVEITGRKVRNRRRATSGAVGTADVSVGDARRAPHFLRTRTK